MHCLNFSTSTKLDIFIAFVHFDPLKFDVLISFYRMDPLSVITSITGILAVTAKLTTVVTGYIQKERNAPTSMSTVVQEMCDLRICLAQLDPIVRGTKPSSRTQRAAISVEQMVVVFSSCVINLAKLEQILDSFRMGQPLSAFSRMRWVKQESEINKLLVRIRASRSSLNLMLTIFNW